MDPLLRIVWLVIGAALGAGLGSSASHIFGALIGGIAAFAVAELSALRSQMTALNDEVKRLKTRLPHVPEASDTPVRAIEAVEPIAQSATTAHIESQHRGAAVQPAIVELPWRELEGTKPAEVPTSAFEPPFSRPTEVAPQPELPIVGAIRSFFTGGNALVRVGVIILFFGVAFLLRYMAEHTHVPIEFRLTGIVLGGIVLLIFGWRLRATRAGYALALQGGAVGILYLTVFAALRLYAILPAAIAFPILVAIAALSAILAVLQNSMSFALLAVTGGFVAPVLASTGDGNHVVLFSYYAVLNAGILAMAWFKTWRPLNIAGFVFTFAIGTVWGVLRYRPEAFASTEPFLILFFLFYLTIAILFTLRQPVDLKGYIDGTLIFGTPIVVFALQSMMLHERLMPLAFSAVAMSAVYLTIAWSLKRRRADSQTLLVEAFTALGVAFITLAVPLALDARWNAAAWALEGAALVWVGCRQDRVLARVSGALLILAAGCITGTQFDVAANHVVLSLNAYCGVILLSVAAILSAQTINAYRNRLKSFELLIPDLLFWFGLCWWFIGGVSEICQYWHALAAAGSLIFTTLTALACSAIYRVTQLNDAKIAALLQLPVMFVFALLAMSTVQHPFVSGGWLAWPLAFVGLYSVMYGHEGAPRGPLANLLNTGSAWLFCAVFSWEAAWAVGNRIGGSASWSAAAWVVIPAVFLFSLSRLVSRVKWPFAKNREAYLFIAGVGVAVYLCGWSLVTNLTSIGDSAPLPYVPFLNPLDLGQALVLLVLLRYWRFLRVVRSTGFARIDGRLPIPTLAALSFIWLNAVLLRTLHQWFGIAFGFDSIIDSTLVQTSLSIFWAILAFITMIVAARRRRRIVWLTGAALLVVVIAKLFLVDLSRVGSIERIVSFVGVGLLMLVVGYLSPLPPVDETLR
jgi:uncharacterized membrane protein